MLYMMDHKANPYLKLLYTEVDHDIGTYVFLSGQMIVRGICTPMGDLSNLIMLSLQFIFQAPRFKQSMLLLKSFS